VYHLSVPLVEFLMAWLIALLLALPLHADEPTFNERKLSEWLAMLKEDPTPRKRRGAIVALGAIASANSEAFPTAVTAIGRAMVNDASPIVRQQAATVLGQQKVDDAAIILTELTNAMRQEKDPMVRREVAVTLGRFGKLAKGAVSALADGLKDADLGVRTASADALGRIGPEASETAPALLALLKTDDKALRTAVVFALGRIEPEDKKGVSLAIVQVLQTAKEPELKREAITSLGFLQDTSGEILTALVGQLSDTDAEHRLLAITTIGKFGTGIRVIEAEVVAVLKGDADKNVRLMACRVIAKNMASDSAGKLSLFVERLKSDPAFEVRVAIAEELGALAKAGTPAIPALRQAQRDPQIQVRDAATKAIKSIESPAPMPKPEPKKP
jgi:HEAT repeat protein